MRATFWTRFNQTVGTKGDVERQVAELLAEAQEMGNLGEDEITREDIVAELNSRNYVAASATRPVITREQAIIGGVCFRLHHKKWPLIVSERWELSDKEFNELVNKALAKAKEYVGKRSRYGADWWKYADTRKDWRPIQRAYYANAVYPYKSKDLIRRPYRKVW